MAEFGCEFSDSAELSGLRQQCEAVCFGLSLVLLTVLWPTVAAFSLSSSKDGRQQYGEGCGGRHVQVS